MRRHGPSSAVRIGTNDADSELLNVAPCLSGLARCLTVQNWRSRTVPKTHPVAQMDPEGSPQGSPRAHPGLTPGLTPGLSPRAQPLAGSGDCICEGLDFFRLDSELPHPINQSRPRQTEAGCRTVASRNNPIDLPKRF